MRPSTRPLALAALALACSFDGSALLSAGPPTSEGDATGDPGATTGGPGTSPTTTTPSSDPTVDPSGATSDPTVTSGVDPSSTGGVTVGPGCGDGVLQAGEACDGALLGGNTCEALGLGPGPLACTAECTLDLGGCAAPDTCGDGQVDANEQCDTTNVGDHTCVEQGFTGGVLLCADNCTLDTTGCTNDPPDWYDPAFLKRRALVISKAKVQDSHTDFPVAVVITDPAILASLGDVGGIVFTDAANAELSHEIALTEAARLVVWVELKSLSDAQDTLFYVYYGDPKATGTADPKGTWSNGFLAVWHLEEAVADEQNTGKHPDATQSGHDGTQHGNLGISSGCRVGRCQQLGDADWIESAKPADFKLGDADVTVTAWVNLDNFLPKPSGIFAKSNPGAAEDGHMILGANGAQKLALEQRSIGSLQGSSDIQDQKWHFVAWTQTKDDAGKAERWRLYLDGAEQTNAAYETIPTKDSHLVRLGGATAGTTFDTSMKGDLDEVHVAFSARSAGWIATAFANQGAPATFVAIGAEQPKP